MPWYHDGTGSDARFGNCLDVFGCDLPGLAADSHGNIFYADATNGVIRRITPAGEVTTFAGTFLNRGVGRDGTGTAASFSRPAALAFDAADNLYVTDECAVRKITPASVVTTFAGSSGGCGLQDGAGTSARLSRPTGLAVDASGNVFVADTGNHA